MKLALLYKSPPSQEQNYEFKQLICTLSSRDTRPPLPPTSQAFMKKVIRAETTQHVHHEGLGDIKGGPPIGETSKVTIGVSVGEPKEAQ